MFRNVAGMNGIELEKSPVEEHNAIGAGEKYHARLRRIYFTVRKTYPKLGEKQAVSLPITAMNDTMGPKGLVPLFFVFGVVQYLFVINQTLPDQHDRTAAL